MTSILGYYWRAAYISHHKSTISHIQTTTTGWQRLLGCLKLQVISRKRATQYRALLQEMTYKDKASYGSSPHCTTHCKFSDGLTFENAESVLAQRWQIPSAMFKSLTSANPVLRAVYTIDYQITMRALQFFFKKKPKDSKARCNKDHVKIQYFWHYLCVRRNFLKKTPQTKKNSHTPKTRHAQMRLVW